MAKEGAATAPHLYPVCRSRARRVDLRMTMEQPLFRKSHRKALSAKAALAKAALGPMRRPQTEALRVLARQARRV
jgi:hypothetical protein